MASVTLLSTTLHFTKCFLVICTFWTHNLFMQLKKESCYLHVAIKQPKKSHGKRETLNILLGSLLNGIWTSLLCSYPMDSILIPISRQQWGERNLRGINEDKEEISVKSGMIFKVWIWACSSYPSGTRKNV